MGARAVCWHLRGCGVADERIAESCGRRRQLVSTMCTVTGTINWWWPIRPESSGRTVTEASRPLRSVVPCAPRIGFHC